MFICIDPGHGGSDPGALGPGDRQEKTDNLTYALELERQFRAQGFQVLMIRDSDRTVELLTRPEIANKAKADLYISCHRNGAHNPTAHGVEIWLHTDAGKLMVQWAQRMIEGFSRLGFHVRGTNNSGWPSGVKRGHNASVYDNFAVNRLTVMPSMLIELGFMTNPEDNSLFDRQYKECCTAVVRSTCEYLGVSYQEVPVPPPSELTSIMGSPVVTASQMAAYLHSKNPDAPDYARLYLSEGKAEGVRGDVAFAQSCMETGYWRFGGDVRPDQFNFCGLGATGNGSPGHSFPTPREGIRAQIQHLKAYACNEPLNSPCVDPRYQYVTRGCAPYVEWLGIPDNPQGKGWAGGKGYGKLILDILDGIRNTAATDDYKALHEAERQLRIAAEADRDKYRELYYSKDEECKNQASVIEALQKKIDDALNVLR